MNVNFEVKRSINLLLFLIHSFGGRAKPGVVFLIFYFSDLRFLHIHGRLAFGNVYLAMQAGPAPLNILGLLIEIANANGNLGATLRHYIAYNETGELVPNVRYEPEYLSAEEVECLFLIIQKYKNTDFAVLKTIAMGRAWQYAGADGVISLREMTEESMIIDALIGAIVSRNNFVAKMGDSNPATSDVLKK